MSDRINWTRIEHSYVCGTMSYRDIAKKRGIPMKTIAEEAKKRNWVQKRKQFREKTLAKANARACEEQAEELEAVRKTADRLAEQLEGILADERQLRMYTAVTPDGQIIERELTAINTGSVRNLVGAMKDLTQVLRNLHNIYTPAERQRMEIEREKMDLEQRKVAAEEQTDDHIEIVFGNPEEEALVR